MRANYYVIWKQFNQFFIRLDTKPHSWEEQLVLFIGFMVESKKQSSTIKSYISAIKSVLRDDGVILDMDYSLLSSLTKACRLKNDQVKIQLPITKPVLALLLTQIPRLSPQPQPYLENMYRALYITAYFGLFRIGKLVQSQHVVKAKDVHIGRNKNKLKFVLHTSKMHWKGDKPQIIKLTSTSARVAENHNNFSYSNNICPFIALQTYLTARKRGRRSDEEQFFILQDRSPVTQYMFRSVLDKLLSLVGLDPTYYGSHAFRAGRAVDMYNILKLDVGTIQKVGHWKSNVIFKYLSQA